VSPSPADLIENDTHICPLSTVRTESRPIIMYHGALNACCAMRCSIHSWTHCSSARLHAQREWQWVYTSV
jgi:hypothetical protein